LPAHAEEPADSADEAELHFEFGLDAYKKRDFRVALEHFLASNRLSPNWRVVLNIARAYAVIGKPAEAYRYYLRASHDPLVTDKAKIEAEYSELKKELALVKVNSIPTGATVYLEQVELGSVGKTPLLLPIACPPPEGSLPVTCELTRKLHLVLNGYEHREVSLSLRAGENPDINEELLPSGTVMVGGPAGTHLKLDGAGVPLDSSGRPLKYMESLACNLPCTFRTSPGTHRMMLSQEGFESRVDWILVRAGQQITDCAPLERKKGQIQVVADRTHAEVRVDQDPTVVGHAPAVLSLPTGRHVVTVSATGFHEVRRNVMIHPDRVETLSVELAPREMVNAPSRRSEDIADAPSSVTIIPREELVAFGYPTVFEALRGVRGLYVWDDRSYGSVGVRGLGTLGSYTSRQLLLLNGHSMNDDWTGSAFIGLDGRTDLDDIERIEVVRGPGSGLYGANAFSGVINLVPKVPGQKVGGEVGLSVAGPGVFRGRVQGSGPLGRDGSVTLSASGAIGSGQDYYFPEYVGRDGSSGHAVGSDALTAGTASAGFDWKFAHLQAFLHSQAKEIPTGEFGTILADPHTRQTDTRAFVEAKLDPELNAVVRLLVRVYFDYYQFYGTYAREPDDGGLETDRYESPWGGSEVRLSLRLSEALEIDLGGEGQYHPAISQDGMDENGTFLTDRRSFGVGAAYGFIRYTPSSKIRLQGGARVDAFSTFGASVNPRLAALGRFYANGDSKLLLGTAFRAPSVYELYYNDGGSTQIANPDLMPERVVSGEIEHRHRFTPNFSLLGAFYANYVTDLVVARSTDGANGPLQYQNSETPFLAVGGEVAFRREWSRGAMFEINYSLVSSRYLATGSAETSLRKVANSPMQLAGLKGAVPLVPELLTGAVRVTFEGQRADRYESDGEPTQGKSAPVVILDVVFSGRLKQPALTYSLGAYNLADYRYSLPVSGEFLQRTIPQNGRSFLASLTLRF